MPINHMVVVRREIAVDRPDAIRELCRLFGASKAASDTTTSARDRAPMGREAVEPSVELALQFAGEQELLPRPLSLEEVWEACPPPSLLAERRFHGERIAAGRVAD